MTIRVLRPGLLTTVQDAGRHGLQHLGLCPGGAMDEVALTLANALVGNDAGEAALEITVIGPELQFERDTLVAVCGAEFQGSFPHNRPVLVPAGSRYSVGRAVRGARAYLAVAGGFALEAVLGSRSTYLPGGFGGLEGRALKHGDVLELGEGVSEVSKQRFSSLKAKAGHTVRWSAPPLTLADREPVLIHVIEGQHYEAFDAASQRAFVDAVWRVSPDSNRMGFRLQGPQLSRVKEGSGSDEILSGPAALGSVQVPSSGVPIALMADHQTTGGYPRIAEVVSADVPRLAQLAPGGKVHFARCNLDTAAELRRHMQDRLETALRGIAWSYGR
ncbi:MAG TPA: biotin-dependent carboxyltransferase family protein [Burkholderiales bacterium]|nr:biotin-dependent carboxyltransferase family protein [Burkholderiales bacterium]